MARPLYITYLKYAFAVLYLIALVWILFFIHTPSFARSSLRFQDVSSQLIPFRSIVRYFGASSSDNYVYLLFSNIIGNILLFVPWGILSAQIFPLLNSNMKVAAIAALASTTAELLQYVFHLGVFDVDDIFLNTLGGIAGYMLLKYWRKSCISKKRHVNPSEKSGT